MGMRMGVAVGRERSGERRVTSVGLSFWCAPILSVHTLVVIEQGPATEAR
jgi:hypothetical protein